MIHLSDDWRANVLSEDKFGAVMRLEGEVFRQHKNRRTIRVELAGRAYFVKIHGPTSWREIAKNALRGRWPVLTAKPEWRAIERLNALGVPTVHAVGWGIRGCPPHRLESFIITEALPNVIHLNDLIPILSSLGNRRRSLLMRRIIVEVARIAQALHDHGMNHRDFYLNHFMIRNRDWSKWSPNDRLEIYLIDLHRVQMRRRIPRRWRIKDISGLIFSSLDADLTSGDLLRFFEAYTGTGESWRKCWQPSRWWRAQVIRRAVSLYRSERGKSPPLPASLSSFA